MIQEEIKARVNDFKLLCSSHNVSKLYAFGSATTQLFNSESSDIDLIVELNSSDPIERGESLLDLWDKFEVFFKRKVDLLTESSIKNPVLKASINRTKVLLYDGKRQEVLI